MWYISEYLALARHWSALYKVYSCPEQQQWLACPRQDAGWEAVKPPAQTARPRPSSRTPGVRLVPDLLAFLSFPQNSPHAIVYVAHDAKNKVRYPTSALTFQIRW